MEEKIRNGESISLDDNDIRRISKNGADVILYPELNNYNDIDNVLGEKGAIIILYETKRNFGHWVCLFRVNHNTLEFFDSLGLSVDSELKFVDENMRIELGEVQPHLSNLISKSNYNLIQNKTKLQEFIEDINTCGRWSATRILMRKTPLNEFVRLFTENKTHTPDFWITAFTLLL